MRCSSGVPEAQRFSLRLSAPARRDIAAIDHYTIRTFGEAAALRYLALIRHALYDIANDPALPGAKARPEAFNPEFRFNHLASSRQRIPGETVKEPRHFIIYRQRTGNIVEILRVLHDSRDLNRHLPPEFANSHSAHTTTRVHCVPIANAAFSLFSLPSQRRISHP